MAGLFSTPKPPKPVQMPDPDDKRIKMAYAKEIASARQRSGRLSTDLSSGDSYSGTTTGAP
jgi:hypothetical protein